MTRAQMLAWLERMPEDAEIVVMVGDVCWDIEPGYISDINDGDMGDVPITAIHASTQRELL